MFARQQRLSGCGVADLGRLTQDDGIQIRLPCQHRTEVGIILDPFRLRVAAGDRDQRDAVDLIDRRQMLVARNLAKADETVMKE